ncbi:unnamed protein product, partial [marine sediment metagenome]
INPGAIAFTFIFLKASYKCRWRYGNVKGGESIEWSLWIE